MGKRKRDDDIGQPLQKKLKQTCNWDILKKYIEPENIISPSINILTSEYIWISPSNLKNFFFNDPILDWFKFKKGRNHSKQSHQYNNILLSNGNDFETKIWNYLHTKYPNDTIQIAPNSYDITDAHVINTINHIRRGTPIIYQAPLRDDTSRLQGCCDLLVRNDWLPKLFANYSPIICNNSGMYHIIDIKWTHFKLKADGYSSNIFPLLPVYKAQLGIYNYLLGCIQGSYNNNALLIGKSWQCNSLKIAFGDTWDRPVVLSYNDDFINKITDAIKWARSVRIYASKWKLGEHKYLFPNMCNKYDGYYTKMKKNAAKELGEITQIWNIGNYNRNYAHSQGIYNWKDARCNAQNMGLNANTKIGNIVDKILDVNRNPINFRKRKIDTLNDIKIRRRRLDNQIFFLDFETYPACLLNEYEHNTEIFMIGLGFINNTGEWTFKNWNIFENGSTSYDIVKQFINFIDTYKNVKIFHWSHAETTHLNKYNKSFKKIKKIKFVDLYKIFYDNKIVIPGALTFGLKDVANAMYSNGMITTKWPCNIHINNGLDAMLLAIELLKTYMATNNYNKAQFENIKKYNEIDCKVLMEINNWLNI